jgi:hypothetical protein
VRRGQVLMGLRYLERDLVGKIKHIGIGRLVRIEWRCVYLGMNKYIQSNCLKMYL